MLLEGRIIGAEKEWGGGLVSYIGKGGLKDIIEHTKKLGLYIL